MHLFEHLMKEGVGLRQFCDRKVLMEHVKWTNKDVELLERHLRGVGMRKAFTGMGGVLTEYLGMDNVFFPFDISEKECKQAAIVVENIIQRGNFGQNEQYLHGNALMRAWQHIRRAYSQGRKFTHYAPREAAWKIPGLFRWWILKMCRMI